MAFAMITFSAFGAYAQEDAVDQAPPTVIELYSSTTCQYCPQAQASFEGLIAKHDNIIPLVCYIDQTKMLQDPVERPFCGPRLHAYAGKLDYPSPGTPMYLINGQEIIPNVQTEYEAFMMESVRTSTLKPIKLRRSQTVNLGYFMDLPQVGRATGDQTLQLWVAVIRKPVMPKTIPASTKPYTNVVDSLSRIGEWNGVAKQLPIKLNPPADSEKLVILAEDNQKRIVAAGQLVLP